MIITEEQKGKLHFVLTKQEFDHLMSFVDNLENFQTELDDLIISRFDERDEATPQSEELQCIYDEIYNQN